MIRRVFYVFLAWVRVPASYGFALLDQGWHGGFGLLAQAVIGRLHLRARNGFFNRA